jgi:hypothetical protein
MSLKGLRLVQVTGKGGVGKSTVCMAMGLAAAREGLRTLIVETSGSQNVPGFWSKESRGYDLVWLGPRLACLSVTPEAAIEDYVVQQIHFRRLFHAVFRNRVIGPFIDAVPGLHDAVQLGKVFDLLREKDGTKPRWDLVILDAPATGHGLTMLGSARAMMELTRAGPLFDGVAEVDAVVGDPHVSGLVLVGLAEELPVNETLQLYEKLRETRSLVRLCVLNLCVTDPMLPQTGGSTPDPALSLVGEGAQQHAWPTWALQATTLLQARRLRSQSQELAKERLTSSIPAQMLELPDLRFKRGELNLEALEELSQHFKRLFQ